TIETMSEYVTDATLISAYDIHHHKVKTPITFPAFLIIDSGGYEVLQDHYIDDLEYPGIKPKKWDLQLYEKTLKKIKLQGPTAFVSLDHPKIRNPIEKQIKLAAALL